MAIKETMTRISNSSNALIVLSAITTVASVIAAKCEKPKVAFTLLGFSTTLQVREVYVRHQGGVQVLRKINISTNDISELDVPAHIVGAMKSSKASEPKTETEEEFLARIDPENFIH